MDVTPEMNSFEGVRNNAYTAPKMPGDAKDSLNTLARLLMVHKPSFGKHGPTSSKLNYTALLDSTLPKTTVPSVITGTRILYVHKYKCLLMYF